MKKLGILIRKNRINLSITQGQLARKIGVSRQSVISWENGTQDLGTRNFIRIIDLLGIDYSEAAKIVMESEKDNDSKK